MADLDLSNVRVLTHSAVRIEAHDGTAIYFDPFQLAEEPHDASVALITHDHYDHFSPEDVAKVANERTVFVAPATCAEGVRDKLGLGEGRVIAARPGERLDVALPALPAAGGNAGTPATLAVEAVPAYNVQPDRLNFHPQANEWLGYVVAVGDVRYYVCGDTDQNPENEHVACDVAIVPIGGTYTMDAAQAAAFVNALRPRAAVPTHYGTAVGPKDAVDAFVPLVDDAIQVAVKMEWPKVTG